ncbi:hypothetical protein TRL7639_01644 [Falsiruegeria litorea R37]|uniref:AAA+ ATPase domain-containing protein n=1 Tax=Falsiruegeria litorea R37 TaxID=1200284 RepID=A0A1Y5SAL8_9RHOB|nr:AAA family ATPase [Falsiruegeria litorea]SLN35171.1 hypothetical protein TRL7639_01644 [Falsiruegeria litorea R37]
MIESIELTCGPTHVSDPVKWNQRPGLTIFVGPNNSGKSALLDDLYNWWPTRGSTKRSSLNDVQLTPFQPSMFEEHPKFRGSNDKDSIVHSGTNATRAMWAHQFERYWGDHEAREFRLDLSIWMNGTNRLDMLTDETDADLQSPTTPLARLLADDDRRAEFQAAVFSGLNHFPIVDWITEYGTLNLAFSPDKPDVKVEKSFTPEMQEYLAQSNLSSRASSGFKAYTGILGTLYATDYKLILIDEPEAFLHPPLARTLGKQVAEQAKDRHVFVATHSADFLMGAVDSGASVRVVRLQYQDGVATACMLDSEDLKQFMTDPLLRSSNVLSGLFAQSVIVAEADTDRNFYQEINNRLLAEGDGRGIENAVFLNAHEKSTVPRIVAMLRKMGVPTAGIVDVDVVADRSGAWTNQLRAVGIPSSMHSELSCERKTILHNMKENSSDPTGKSYKNEGAIDLLSNGELKAARSWLRELANFGLFVVPIGELEHWLPELEVREKGRPWLGKIFSKMGSDPKAPDYIHPAKGDVWDFIADCNAWLTNPARQGMGGVE